MCPECVREVRIHLIVLEVRSSLALAHVFYIMNATTPDGVGKVVR